jgi:hypothetical protein
MTPTIATTTGAYIVGELDDFEKVPDVTGPAKTKRKAKPKAKKAVKKKAVKAKRKPAPKKKAKAKPAKKVASNITRPERLDLRLTKAEKAKLVRRSGLTRRTVTSIVLELIEKMK